MAAGGRGPVSDRIVVSYPIGEARMRFAAARRCGHFEAARRPPARAPHRVAQSRPGDLRSNGTDGRPSIFLLTDFQLEEHAMRMPNLTGVFSQNLRRLPTRWLR